MKTSDLCVLVLSFGLLTQGSICLAADPQPSKVVPKIRPSTNAATGAPLRDAKNLYKPVTKMKIAPDTPAQGVAATAVTRVSGAIQTIDPLGSGVDALQRAGAELRAVYDATQAKLSECRNADYSLADQAAASCREEDTIDTCNRKLLASCVTPVFDKIGPARAVFAARYNKTQELLRAYVEQYKHY